MLQRAITGLFFVVIVIVSLWYNYMSAFIGMTLFFVLGIIEYFRLFKNHSHIHLSPVGIVVALAIYLIGAIVVDGHIDVKFVLTIPALLFIIPLAELWRNKTNPILNIGVGVFGVFYVVFPFLLILALSKESTHLFPYVIAVLLLIWTNDTFAYLTGRLIGKTKLFERISPKKTWEGTIGGIIFTMVVGYLVSLYTPTNDAFFWIVSGLIVAPSAIFGDLIESLFKRNLGIKDSGTILPGHGGILDRFDATLFAIPFFYVWYLINH